MCVCVYIYIHTYIYMVIMPFKIFDPSVLKIFLYFIVSKNGELYYNRKIQTKLDEIVESYLPLTS